MSPLVIVLEGPNGTGKTTLSRMLSNGSPRVGPHGRVARYRAFERALTGHENSLSLREALKSAGVPLNTHVDDLYVADAIQNLYDANDVVILDRSFPSGLAYARAGIERAGTVTGEARAIFAADQRARDAPEHVWRLWLQSWASMLPRRLYVTLQATYATARARTAERTRWFPTPEQHEKLETQFQLIHSLLDGPRLLIDTETTPVSDVLEQIRSRVAK